MRSWAAPATGVGLALTNTLHAIGFHGVATGSVLSVTRLLGLLTAVAFTLWLLWHAEDRGWVRSLALSLILFVELGPVVQPWYLAWGLVLLAAATRVASTSGSWHSRSRGRSLDCRAVDSFGDLIHSNPLLTALAVAIVGGVLLLPMGRWTQWSWPAKELEPAAYVGDHEANWEFAVADTINRGARGCVLERGTACSGPSPNAGE